MVNAGSFLWNAGIFMARAVDMTAAFAKHAPAYEPHIRAALDRAEVDLGFLRLDADAWDQTDAKSIDYAVMEKADNLTVVPFDGVWSDMGGWDAVWRDADKSDTAVATVGDATAIDCENSLIRSETNGLEIVGIGLRNILAVAMEDAVLVADMSRAQDVKRAVQILTEKGAEQATKFPKEHRPWGWFERLVLGGRFQVKRIHVHPGEALSLQSHLHRSEHWVVVEGTAEVTIGDDTNLISENQSVYIPIGSKHRLANPGKVPVVLIEVQTGAYVGEDDIIRYADKYARQPGE
jgi:mannose-1-phosphate guanylyltransferase/mannose-6-phosphate isomerase